MPKDELDFMLDGIIVARGWLDNAKLKQDTEPYEIACYQRLLDNAIEAYHAAEIRLKGKCSHETRK